MAIVELHQVAFAYGPRQVLQGVSLRVQDGSRVAIIGANGAGKTTLLKVIGGVLAPGRAGPASRGGAVSGAGGVSGGGTVRIDGADVAKLPKRQMARIVAMVPQDLVVPFSFTAREIVELGRTAYIGLFGSCAPADRRAVDHAMAATDSTDLAWRMFNELSGGERQRVLIAMALAQEPRVLLLDEPTQRLDLTRQAEILDLIRDVSLDRGLTVVAAIHDLNLVAMYFDRVIVLANGGILADGAAADVMRPDVLERAYAGPLRFVQAPGIEMPIVLPRSNLKSTKDEGES